jgi:hypothetical protein
VRSTEYRFCTHLDPSAAAHRVQRILHERSQCHRDLRRIDVGDQRLRGAAAQERRPLLLSQRSHFGDDAVGQLRHIRRQQLERRRTGEQHQVRNHLVRAKRLLVDCGQLAAALRIALIDQQRLGPRGDIRQRVIDLVRKTVGELIERLELRSFEGSDEVRGSRRGFGRRRHGE